MIDHHHLLATGFTGRRRLAILINTHVIQFAGNRALKIYGLLDCASGKRMKTTNRVFFSTEQEAIDNGYRPCGHCLRRQYHLWKEIK